MRRTFDHVKGAACSFFVIFAKGTGCIMKGMEPLNEAGRHEGMRPMVDLGATARGMKTTMQTTLESWTCLYFFSHLKHLL